MVKSYDIIKEKLGKAADYELNVGKLYLFFSKYIYFSQKNSKKITIFGGN